MEQQQQLILQLLLRFSSSRVEKCMDVENVWTMKKKLICVDYGTV